MGEKSQVYVGCGSGLFKGLSFVKKKTLCENYINQECKDTKDKVVSLAWTESENENEVLVSYTNSTCIFNVQNEEFTPSKYYSKLDSSPLISVYCYLGVNIGAKKAGQIFIDNGEDLFTFRAFSENQYFDKRKLLPFLSTIKQNPHEGHQLASAGCENLVTLWDINTQTPIFTAKNVKHDMLELRVPVWVTDMTFMPMSQHIASCTHYHQIRLYDVKSNQRRPVIDFSWDSYSFNKIVSIPWNDKQVIVSNSKGTLALFDLRLTKKDKPNALAVYHGFGGSIKDLVIHPSFPLLFSVSLDRYLRVHHIMTKKMLLKEYLKSRLSCVLLSKDVKEDELPFEVGPTVNEFEKGKKKI